MTALRKSASPRTLGQILAGLVRVSAKEDRPVFGLSLDSRQTQKGDLFLACAGSEHHGIAFAQNAIDQGCAAVAYEPTPNMQPLPRLNVPLVAVPALGSQLGLIGDRFYRSPSSRAAVVGVTGTNGKTSIAHYLGQSLHAHAGRCGFIGTLGSGFYGALAPVVNTTPDAISIQRELAQMTDAGARYAVMEVSSHGLDQGRINNVQFHTAVYTNLSRDHLDYHIDLRSYADAKARLFRWPDLQSAVLNADDGFGRRLAAMTSAEQTILYTLGEPDTGEVAGQWLIGRWDGRQLSVSGDFGMGVVESGLVGEFNAANLLGALGALLALRVPFRDALELISKVRPAPGRMERFEAEHCADVYVDYAHTPDALQSALGALAETYDEIWCVFGCGGERDRGKRPEMGAVAEKFSAHVVLTDDNPRRESGDLIIKDILTGMRRTANTTLLRDRRAAIEYALTHAGRDCCVLVAGKGHEQVQVLGNRIEKFDDRQVVQALMQELLS